MIVAMDSTAEMVARARAVLERWSGWLLQAGAVMLFIAVVTALA